MSETHHALVQRFLEQIWHEGNRDTIEELLAPNSARSVRHPGMRGGRALEKEGMRCTRR